MFAHIVAALIAIAMVVPVPGNTTTAQLDAESSARTISSGVWGGEHIRMDINKDGAEIEFDCASGTITRPIALDAKRQFRVEGTFRRQIPAPAQANDTASTNAIYLGTLHGDTMRLQVSVSGVDGVQSFTLVKGNEGHLTKCA